MRTAKGFGERQNQALRIGRQGGRLDLAKVLNGTSFFEHFQ
jgi:hypothetical protein